VARVETIGAGNTTARAGSNALMLEVSGLTKVYPNGLRALHDVSLNVPRGIFGLLGPNGAGKSTLLRILATLLEPDAGSVRLGGLDIVADKAAARRRSGYLPQEFGFYSTFSVEEMLDYLVALKGYSSRVARRSEVGRLLELVNLEDARRRRVGALSGGMAQRLGIAQALAGSPELLLLDEPTVGLDPEERVRLFAVLARAAAGAAVVLSTHIVSDVITVCDRFAVLRGGEVVRACTPAEAVADLEGTVWEATQASGDADGVPAGARALVAYRSGGALRVRVHSPSFPGEGFAPVAPSLEDAYFEAVGRPGPDA
jgi:ABC-2 type transport system ATP-binding protein